MLVESNSHAHHVFKFGNNRIFLLNIFHHLKKHHYISQLSCRITTYATVTNNGKVTFLLFKISS